MDGVLPMAERLTAAARLMEAIAACDPRDFAVLLSSALETLAAGEPGVPFLDIQLEAQDWASFATPQELEAYLEACAVKLASTTLSPKARERIRGYVKGIA